ncbi:MAG: GNAT family N-acetyltransferase [Nocardioides sp.]|nr:GNAT family N-acetyltransferase [Nocardioides sp.]
MSTPGVRVVHLGLDALAAGDLEAAAAASPVPLTPWLVSGDVIEIWRRRAWQVAETPGDQPWVTGLVWAEDVGTEGVGAVVGRAGFHAAPDDDGMVEVGFAIDPAHRRRGYARAAFEVLLDRARADPGVRTVRVTVSPTNEASLGLVTQYPFVANGEQWDNEDGLELILELAV